MAEVRTLNAVDRAHANTFGARLSFDRNFFHALWHNRPVLDEKEFVRGFREDSFSSAVLATWAAAVVGTLNAVNREIVGHQPLGLALAQTVFALYWVPALTFTVLPRLSKWLYHGLLETYQWLLDAVFAFYYLRLGERVLAIPLDAAVGNTPSLMTTQLDEANLSLVMLILFTTVFLRLPFRHAFVLSVIATASIDLLAWIHCGFEASFRLLFTTGLSLALSLAAAWRREERERKLFSEKKEAQLQSIRADEERERTKVAAADTEVQRWRAEQAASQAEQARRDAEEAADRAEALQIQAEAAADEALVQEALAEELRSRAERAATAQQALREELEELHTQQGLMIRALHHDANNTLLKMGSDVLELENHIAQMSSDPCQPRDPITSPALPRLGHIAEGLRFGNAELSGMMAGMYDLVDAGKYEPKYTRVAVGELLRAVEDRFNVPARHKELDFRIRQRRDDLYIWTDPTAIQRILFNLVSNAIKYTRTGGVVVGAVRHRTLLRFDIWDTGVGIPENKRRDIFREFVRLHSDDDTKGLGLGLAIVNHFRQKLQGHHLELNSRVNKGSRFSITVPLAAPPPKSVPIETSASLPVGRRYVVVVEDDEDVQDSICSILNSAGYGVEDFVRVVSSVAEVANLFDKQAKRAPDVVICDFRLRDGESGNDVIRLIDERFSWTLQPVPIVVFTAEINPAVIPGRLNLRVVSKSGDPSVLIGQIEVLLGSIPVVVDGED